MAEVVIEPQKNNAFKEKLKNSLGLSNPVAAKIKIKSVVVNTKEETCHVGLKVPENFGIADNFASQKGNLLSKGQLEFEFEYYDPDLPLELILEEQWEEILAQVKAKASKTSGWLSSTKWALEGNTIIVKVKSQVAQEALENKNCARVFKEVMAEEYHKEVNVKLEMGDFAAESKEIADEQEEEKKNYMQDLAQSMPPAGQRGDNSSSSAQPKKDVWYGKKFSGEVQDLDTITSEQRGVIVEGEVFDLDVRELQSGNNLIIFAITDRTNSIKAKAFEDKNGTLVNNIDTGEWVKIKGDVQYDKYDQELALMSKAVLPISKESKIDTAEDKRVELHMHTQMSAMDSVVDIDEIVKRADEWGHEAIAVTDHGVVQAFPEAYQAAQGRDIKMIYGIEAYLVDDGEPIILNPNEKDLEEETYVVFDLETTGFNPHHNQIIEIGATKIEAGKITDSYQTFVNPEGKVPERITELTGITDSMVADAPSLKDAVEEFLAFVGDAALVAHNLSFDLGFIEDKLKRLDKDEICNPALDTLNLSRALLSDLKSYKLKKLAKKFNVDLDNHHRADDDAEATAQIFLELVDLMLEQEVDSLDQINSLTSKIDYKRMHPYHATILVKNQTGLKNLYKLVSQAHVENFHRVPRILKSDLLEKREGLIVGSACEAGQLYKAVLQGKSEDKLIEIAKFYDYLEVQPIGNAKFLLEDGEVESMADLKEINQTIYQLGEKLGKPVAAAGDVHFIDPEDSIYRQILMEGQGFDDADQQAPLYFRTTDEMLDEFDYFSQDVAYELVVENPKEIVEGIEEVKPVPEGLFTPTIEGAEENVRNMAYQKAKDWYGDPLPELVEDRLENELESIIGNGYAVIYLISQKLVKKSLEDGYLVGSRGSVGSSFAATMTDITEVNPLPPHYRCPECKYAKFFTDGSIGVGIDLDDKSCPECGTALIKDGFDIPFEVFLGFEGDKVPDIDLNFSGEYQPQVHNYTEELFGEEYVYRAGTISTIADRTAYGFVKGHMEDNSLTLRGAEVDRLVDGCTGARKTTGQHPGGLMVIPEEKDVYDFTPIQKPANDMDSDTLTTHFDYHSISGRILKLDILGHDDPTSIRMLQDITGVDPQEIPLDDPQTMKIFSSIEPLEVIEDEVGVKLGTLGIPEFGTSFVRGMLRETRPTTFAELVRISGLSHGADVWLNNAQDLIRSGTAKLSEVISVRDDIMNYLLQKGVEPSTAFWIMEHVRKGKGLTDEEEQVMRENNVPNWYIKSCKKINYMFPKAHAAAYVMMAYRIAYFKVHYPEAFYNTYFSIKSDDFDAQIVLQGQEFIEKKIAEINNKGNDATAKDKRTLRVLRIVVEALARGISFCPVDIYESQINRFQITEEGLRPPLISLDGLGTRAAENIVDKREEEFTSIEDLSNQASLSKTVIEVMREHGCLDDLPETNQLSLFG
ncbi:MAG: PolC-type DNA polymerase III [Halanaerobacter sp.]